MSMAHKKTQDAVEGDGLPPDAVAMKELLKSMGVIGYEPRVAEQLMSFMYRHVADILLDAEAYRQRLDLSGEIEMEDLLLAIQSREAFNFVQPPAQNVISEMAAQRNKQPLPDLSDRPGLIIPANSLLGPNYQLNVPSDDTLPTADSQRDSELMQNGSSRPTQRPKASITFNIAQQMEEG